MVIQKHISSAYIVSEGFHKSLLAGIFIDIENKYPKNKVCYPTNKKNNFLKAPKNVAVKNLYGA